jgi:hypothetical protein
LQIATCRRPWLAIERGNWGRHRLPATVIKITMQKNSQRMRRLLAAGLLPGRAGQPVKALVHVSLADLMLLDGSSALMDEWSAQVRSQWAAARAAASQGGSDGGAWLDGDAARGFTCDALVTPVVTGEVNPAALEDLIRLCAELDKRRHAGDHAEAPGARARTMPSRTRPPRRRWSRRSSARPRTCYPAPAA